MGTAILELRISIQKDKLELLLEPAFVGSKLIQIYIINSGYLGTGSLASTDNNVHYSTLVNRAHLNKVCPYFSSFPETKAKMENDREGICLSCVNAHVIIGMEKTNGYILYRMLTICFRLYRCAKAGKCWKSGDPSYSNRHCCLLTAYRNKQLTSSYHSEQIYTNTLFCSSKHTQPLVIFPMV